MSASLVHSTTIVAKGDSAAPVHYLHPQDVVCKNIYNHTHVIQSHYQMVILYHQSINEHYPYQIDYL